MGQFNRPTMAVTSFLGYTDYTGDAYPINTDANGDKLLSKTFGEVGKDGENSVQLT